MWRGNAFLISVAVAAVTMTTAFDVTAGGPFSPEILGFVAVQIVAAFALIGIATVLPCLAAIRTADRWNLKSPIYWVGCALAGAAVATALGAAWMSYPRDGDPDQITFSVALRRFVVWTIPAGLIGGVAFWFLGVKKRVA